MTTTAVRLRLSARVLITFIDIVFSGIPSYTSRAHTTSGGDNTFQPGPMNKPESLEGSAQTPF